MRRLLVALSACLSLYVGVSQGAQLALSNHPQWHSLLHFDRAGTFSQPRSAVLDDAFFLAENGPFDPQAELAATLAALRLPARAREPHARCRFPARARWLTQMTGEQWPEASCPEWDDWQSRYGGSEVGLMFASGYLGNPASFFGHLMLHLEKSDEDGATSVSRLLDTSFNFGADVPADDGLVTYMAKGMLGGYEARYSHASFYRNNTVYSEREMRDLWHYRLNLPLEKRELLIAHLYEIRSQHFDYLFLTQNCASRIARTLELVIDRDLTPGRALWVAPETLIRAIGETQGDNQPLLQETRHVPSRRLQTERHYQALNRQEQQAVPSTWPDIEKLELNSTVLRALPAASQARVLDTLLSHAAFLKQAGDAPNQAETERRLLQARLALPQASTSQAPGALTPLHEATPSSLVRVEGLYNDEQGEALRLTLRPLQYDLLDSNTTRMPNAALEIGRVELSLTDETARLRRLSLFHITNLHAQSVPLPTLPSAAWHASGGIERSNLACHGCLEAHTTLLAGKSFRVGRYLPFAMVGGQARTERYQSGAVAPSAQLGVLTEWSAAQRTLLQATHTDSFKGAAGRRTHWQLQHRLAIDKSLDARIGIEHDERAEEVSIGLSWYF
ncbi:Lnb N-terminal periplasmic domain-containing protein [Vreelandella sp. TE19]